MTTNHDDTIAIRPCQDRDLPAITAIYAHHVRHGLASFEIEPPDEAEMRRRHATILGHGLPYFVAVRNDVVLGYAYAGPYRPRAAYHDTVENSIYIRPDVTGQGIGGRLLPILVEACAAAGRRQMIAVVGDSANLASIRLHERHGFHRVGTLRSVGYKHGRWLDSVLLQRSLGPGDTSPPSTR